MDKNIYRWFLCDVDVFCPKWTSHRISYLRLRLRNDFTMRNPFCPLKNSMIVNLISHYSYTNRLCQLCIYWSKSWKDTDLMFPLIYLPFWAIYIIHHSFMLWSLQLYKLFQLCVYSPITWKDNNFTFHDFTIHFGQSHISHHSLCHTIIAAQMDSFSSMFTNQNNWKKISWPFQYVDLSLQNHSLIYSCRNHHNCTDMLCRLDFYSPTTQNACQDMLTSIT